MKSFGFMNKTKTFLMISALFYATVVPGCGQQKTGPGTDGFDDAVRFVGRQRLEARLKDPSSLEIINEEVIKPGRYGSEVGYRAKYRAKNSFGGYVVDEFYTE